MFFFLRTQRYYNLLTVTVIMFAFIQFSRSALLSSNIIVSKTPCYYGRWWSSRRFQQDSAFNLDDIMIDLLENPPATSDFIAKNNNETNDLEGSDSQIGWRRMDWNRKPLPSPLLQPSPVDTVLVRDRIVYVKRDDKLRLPGSQISGNKARKMMTLNDMMMAWTNFPSCVVSHGGPQSNAMLALAALVHYHNKTSPSLKDGDICDTAVPETKFVYFTKKLPRFLRKQPIGNLFRALSLGMEMVQLSPQEYNKLFESDSGGRTEPPPGLLPPIPGNSLWIPQGGACGMAEAGTSVLAKEIVEFWLEHGENRPLSVCIPSGTCSTAVFLHRALKVQIAQIPEDEQLDIQVIAVPCVGDESYARRQMMALNVQTNSSPNDIPTILRPSPDETYFGQSSTKSDNRYFTFGEPNLSILDTFNEMRDVHNVDVDLLYGAPSWTIMLRHWRIKAGSTLQFNPTSPLSGREIMYVHSGGMEGISSQLKRYKYKGLIEN